MFGLLSPREQRVQNPGTKIYVVTWMPLGKISLSPERIQMRSERIQV